MIDDQHTQFWSSSRLKLLLRIGTMGLLLSSCDNNSLETTDLPRPIAWVDVVSAEAAAVRSVPAVIQSKDRAELAFQVPGRVGAVNVSVGDSVEENAVLATLDDQTFRLTLQQRQAELAQANAGLVEAQSEYKRDQDLIKDGAISQSEFERSRARRDTARGNVDLLSAAVELAEKNLDFTQLRAPYAGEITDRIVEPAQQVRVGQTVLGIQIKSVLEASMTVPEDWINRLASGSQHTLTLRSQPNLVIKGRITEIGRAARANNAYPITLELENPPDTVRSGMSAEVLLTGAISKSHANAVLIPLTAFLSGTEQTNYVFVVDQDAGLVQKRNVELGEIVANGVTVTDGLTVGERIAIKGVAYLSDGQSVTLMDIGPERYLQ